jgi:hypothetical protein
MTAQTPATLATRIGQYKAIEVKIDQMDKDHEAKIKPLRDLKALLLGYFEQTLTQSGAQNIATPLGTIHWTTRSTASLEDAQKFMDYVIAHQKFELMDRRANAAAVRDYADKSGIAPQDIGVKLSTLRTVGVLKPSSKNAAK